jgi:lipid A 3-O-deacylase
MSVGGGRTGTAVMALLLLLGLGADGTVAADLWGPNDLVFGKSTLYRPDRWELRGGGFAHCCFVEKGFDLGLELVTPRPFLIPFLPEFFSPRLHFGGIANFRGHTSWAYAGLLYTFNLTERIFLEPFVGIAFSNGSALGDATHNSIGCTTLIHSGGNIGIRLDHRWSAMLTLNHISNGNLCSRNAGVNAYGAKVGYSF